MPSRTAKPDIQRLLAGLISAGAAHAARRPTLWVACSGGRDSTLLLHLLARSPESWPGYRLRVVHVDHRLHIDSGRWALHVRRQATDLAVPFTLLPVQVPTSRGQGLEQAARDVRYRALAALLQSGDLVATAHHAEDQVETVLLRLLRGAGPQGLAGMPASRPLGAGRLIRPLLTTEPNELAAWTAEYNLRWVRDPANADRHHDRNYLRHEVLPVLRARWPGLSAPVLRSASLCRDLAVPAVAAARDEDALDLAPLEGVAAAQQRHALRAWLAGRGLRMPSLAHLDALRQQLFHASRDRQPRWTLDGMEVLRFRGQAYLYTVDADRGAHVSLTDNQWWRVSERARLPWGGDLYLLAASGQGLRPAAVRGGLRIAVRRGGERLLLRGHHRRLKTLFQEWRIAPWLRSRWPLLFDGDALVAVPSHAVADAYRAPPGEPGWWPVYRLPLG